MAEAGCVTAERPREPQGSVSVARGAGAGLGPGPGGCRPRAARRRGWPQTMCQKQRGRASEREPRGASRLRLAGWGGVPPPRRGRRSSARAFGWPRPPPAAERAAPVSWVPRSRGLVPASRSRSPLARPSLPPRRREPFPARRRRSGRPWRAGQPRPVPRRRHRACRRRALAGGREREKGQRASPARAPPKAAQRPPLLPRSVGGGRRGRRGRVLAVGALLRREAPCRRRAVPRGAATWLILPVAYACLKD